MSGLHLHSCRLRTGNEDAEMILPQCSSPKRLVCWHILTVSENVSHATTHPSFLNLSQHSEKSTAVPVLEQSFSSWKQILAHCKFRLCQLRMDFHFCSLHKSLIAPAIIFTFKYLIPCILALTWGNCYSHKCSVCQNHLVKKPII